MTTIGYGLIGGVFKLLHLINCLSDSSNKIPVVHMILFIVVIWCRVNEFTKETHFYIQQKEKKKKGKKKKQNAKCLKFQHATRCFLKTHIHSKSRSKEHVSAEEKRKKKKKKNITNDEVHSIFLSLGLN